MSLFSRAKQLFSRAYVKEFMSGCAVVAAVASPAKADEIRLGVGREASTSLLKAVEDVFLTPHQVSPESRLPRRTVSPYVVSNNGWADPRAGFESTTSHWDTINEIVGKGADFVGIALQGDKEPAGRVLLFIPHLYCLIASNYLSHELAHFYPYKWSGAGSLRLVFGIGIKDTYQYDFNGDGAIDLSVQQRRGPNIDDFGALLFRLKRTTRKELFKDESDLDDRLFVAIAGLNQQELNLDHLYRQFAKNDTVFFDQSMNFLLNRFFTIAYLGISSTLKVNSLDEYYRGGGFDGSSYRAGLKRKGVGVSRDGLILENSLATLLSGQAYYSGYSVFKYFSDGQRVQGQYWFESFGVKMTLPLVTHYFTPEGGFYDVSLFVKDKKLPLLEFHVGTNTWNGKLDVLRAGGQIHGVRVGGVDRGWFSLSPYAYANFSKSQVEYTGGVAGIELEVPILSNSFIFSSLVGKIEYSDGDILESVVKREKEGVNVSLTVKVSF